MFNSLNVKELIDKMEEVDSSRSSSNNNIDINKVIERFNDRNSHKKEDTDLCGSCIHFNSSWGMCEHLWEAVHDDTQGCSSHLSYE